MSFGFQHWNRATSVKRFLASNSYTVYIIHYPIHTAFAVLLMSWNIPVAAKAVILYLMTFLASYVLSGFLVRPYPRVSVLIIVLVNITMLAVI